MKDRIPFESLLACFTETTVRSMRKDLVKTMQSLVQHGDPGDDAMIAHYTKLIETINYDINEKAPVAIPTVAAVIVLV